MSCKTSSPPWFGKTGALFTSAPWMQLLFDPRAVALMDGLVIILIGVAMFLTVEAEKPIRALLLRWPRRRSRAPSAGSSPGSAGPYH
jgi:hypothetical protein